MKLGNGAGITPFEHFPSNDLEEWAKVDFSAALELFLSGAQFPFNDLGDIIKSFVNLAKPETAYPSLAEQYETLDASSREKFASGIDSAFPNEMGVQPLFDLLTTIPSESLLEQLAMDRIKGFGGTRRGNDFTYVNLINAVPTPAKRLEAIRQGAMGHGLLETSDAKLAELGTTREHIKQLESE